ncbi:MAG: hypothetical protein EPO52_17580 [Herbiconiux sp.]|uniref:hypothetical protein n=1 Tax=Herbiconiux sp. TaxID=1871186 RepID=UPI0011FAB135|nr:hypothetical protein [Herbiconiux sp.]TAJ46344.1 MAG: hypothetical protein EPO52_17580 [Herbiconiux sp.]
MSRADTILQFAMFMQARDARPNGKFTGVAWDMLEPLGGQAEYLKDAEAYLAAIEALGYRQADEVRRETIDEAASVAEAQMRASLRAWLIETGDETDPPDDDFDDQIAEVVRAVKEATRPLNALAEMAWAGYLSYLHSVNEVPDDPAAVWAMKADFLSGFDDTPNNQPT